MKKLLIAFVVIIGSINLVASDKHARREQYEKSITAKERELLKEARRNPNTGTAPVVVFTGKSKSSTK